MSDKHATLTLHIMFSRNKKYNVKQRVNWQHANRQDRAGMKQGLSIQIL